MFRQTALLVVLLVAPAVANAMPRGCSALAAEGKDLWIVEEGQVPRHVLAAEKDISAAAWSPDGRLIAYSWWYSTTIGTEVIIAEVGGRIVGGFKVDKPQGDGGLRFIFGLEWREPRTLLTMGSQGLKGGYLDVWRLARDYSGAERIRRVLVLGGPWSVSPSMHFVASVDEDDSISFYDTLGPADEDGVVNEDPVSGTSNPGWSLLDSPSEGVESNLVWDAVGVLYAVQSLSSQRVLTTIEQSSGAAGGWRITDRELSGVDSPVRGIEIDADGGLLLYDSRQALRVDLETAAPRSGLAARAASVNELRWPEVLEVVTERGNLELRVLDTRCE